VELVVAFPSKSGDGEAFVDRARRIGVAREAVAQIPGVSGTLAADTFLPPATGAGPVPRPPQRIVERLAYVRTDPDGPELWRISARVSAFRAREFAGLTERIERVAREKLTGDARDVVVAGGVTMVARAQQRLLRDLATSAGVAILTITALLSLGLRSLRAGILATVPSVVPLVVVFGALRWTSWRWTSACDDQAPRSGSPSTTTCHIVAAFS
jgi:hypothetical protein